MTVVVWDGKTMAADKRADVGGAPYTVTKVMRLDDMIAGISGYLGHGLAVCAWLEAGRDPVKFPKETDDNGSGYVLVAHRSGLVERFENSPYPIIVGDSFHALGSGRDFALAALHMGKDARESVEVACALSSQCGNGIDSISFESGP